MKKFVFVFLIIQAFVYGQSAGNTGLSFLKIGSGARNIALGDNGAVFGNDVTAVFYNPANLSYDKGAEVMVMHNEWIQGVKSEVLGAKFTLWGQTFGVGFNSTSIGDIEVRKTAGDYETKIGANYFAATLGTGFEIYKGVKAGVAVKYLYESILVDDANGMAVDLGLGYKLNDNISFVASYKNIGQMNKFSHEETVIPQEIRLGAGYNTSLPSQKIEIQSGVEFQKYTKTDDYHINLGVEGIYDNTFALRLGYQSNYESKSFTGGVGIYWGRITFDYALSPFRYDLGSGHTVSLKVKF